MVSGAQPAASINGLEVEPIVAPGVDVEQLPREWTVRAERQDGDPGDDPVRETTGELGSKARLNLDSGTWWITLRTPGAWAAPFEVTWPEPEPIHHVLRLHPAGRIEGELTNRGALDGFGVGFKPVDEEDDALPAGWAPCFVEDPEDAESRSSKTRRFTCEVPVGVHDLRFRARGFAEAYVWAVESSLEAHHDVGRLTLIPGASLVGWVEVEASRAPLDEVDLTVRPEVGGESRSPEARRRHDRRIRETRPDERGFFQVVGLEPGAYGVTASLEGFVSAHVEIQLRPDEVARLENPPLTLRRPAELEVFLHPPLPPGHVDEPWQAQLTRLSSTGMPLETVEETSADLGGRLRFPRVPYGRLQLMVAGPEERFWHREILEVELAREELFVDLQLTEVRGRVRRGEDPVFGSLRFVVGITDRASLESDEEGRFEGYLPGTGPWRIDVKSHDGQIHKTLVDVEAEPVPGKSWSRMELQVLQTVLRARAVDPEGRPLENARVMAVAMVEGAKGRDAFALGKTDEEGAVEMQGLVEGKTMVTAEAVSEGTRMTLREAVEVEIRAGDDEAEPLELVLHPAERFEGRVVHGGVPIAGAMIFAMPADQVTAGSPRLVTDENGAFSLELPDSSKRVLLAVGAPGFAYTMLQASTSEPVEIELRRESGTLVVQASPHFFTVQEEMACLFYSGSSYTGGFLPLLALQGWAVSRGSAPWSPPEIEIPEMAPGTYRLCRVPRLQMLSAMQGGVDPARCTEGFLPAGGRLELSLGGGSD